MKSKTTKRGAKSGNRSPRVRINLPFEKAVEGLLAVKPEKKKRKTG